MAGASARRVRGRGRDVRPRPSIRTIAIEVEDLRRLSELADYLQGVGAAVAVDGQRIVVALSLSAPEVADEQELRAQVEAWRQQNSLAVEIEAGDWDVRAAPADKER